MQSVEVDAFEFCRSKDRREGQAQVSDLSRVAAETADGSGQLAWVVQGGSDGRGNPAMELSVQGDVRLQCQRCLQPLDFRIDSAASIVVARDEESADALDEQLAEEETEVIVGSQTLNLLALVEDEVLLALPVAARHEACALKAQPEKPAAEASGKKESPFAVLGKLKR